MTTKHTQNPRAWAIAKITDISRIDKRPGSRGFKQLSEFGNSLFRGTKSSQSTCFIVSWCNQRGAGDPRLISADPLKPRFPRLLSFSEYLRMHILKGLLVVVSKWWFKFCPGIEFPNPLLTSISPPLYLNFASWEPLFYLDLTSGRHQTKCIAGEVAGSYKNSSLPPTPSTEASPLCPEGSGLKKAHKIKRNPQDTGQVSLRHSAGQTGVHRPVSQGFLVVSVVCYFSKTDRKEHFSWGMVRVSQGHPARQGISESFM